MSDPIALEFKEVEGAVTSLNRAFTELTIKAGAVNRADFGQITANINRLNQTNLQQLQTALGKLGKSGDSSLDYLLSRAKETAKQLEGTLTASGKSVARIHKENAEQLLTALRTQYENILVVAAAHDKKVLALTEARIAKKAALQAAADAAANAAAQAQAAKQLVIAQAAAAAQAKTLQASAVANLPATSSQLKLGRVNSTSLQSLDTVVAQAAASGEAIMANHAKNLLAGSAMLREMLNSSGKKILGQYQSDAQILFGMMQQSLQSMVTHEAAKRGVQLNSENARTATQNLAAKTRLAQQAMMDLESINIAKVNSAALIAAESAERARGIAERAAALKRATAAAHMAQIEANERSIAIAKEYSAKHMAVIVADAAAQRALMVGSTGGVGSGKQYTANLPRATSSATSTLSMYAAAPTASTLTSSIPTPAHVASVNNLSTAFRKLTVDGNDVHSMARGLASGFNLLWLTWGNLLPLMAGSAISFGVKKTFDIGSEVEYQVKFVQLLGDLTKEQGLAIRQELRNIDQTTMFSMLELSKLMVIITQAGFSARDALELTKISADLATVGMTTMDVSSKLLIQTMNLFPDSANNVSKTAAQIFQITKDSVLSVENIGGAMQYASTANIAYGQSLEDTLTIYGALAKAGITAQKAGTSYTNMLHDLYGRSGPAIKALKEIEAQTGKAIKQFDEMGKARPAVEIIDDIAKGLQLFTPEKAMKLTNAIFTERGIRSFFSALREGKTELVAYSQMLKELDPEVMFKTSRGLMDTTKGALEQLKGAFIGTLDQVFDSLSGRFKDAVIGVRDYLSSADFGNLVYDMVNSIVSLYEGIVKVLPVIKAFGVAWLGFKTFSLVEAALFSTTKLLAPLTASLGLATAKMGVAAGLTGPLSLGFHGTGVAMLASAAGSRAAAAGLGIVQIEAAKAAVTVTAAAGSTRLLASALGFLAHPLVGIGVTLAMLGATWWMTSKESSTASQALSAKIFENGKVNAAVLENEIRLLNDRAAAAGSPQKTAIHELADAELNKIGQLNEKIANARDELAKKGTAGRRDNLATLMAERTDVTNNWLELQKGADKHQSVLDKQEADREAKRAEAARKAAEKLKSDYERTLNGVSGTPGTSGRGARGPREAAIKDTNKWVKDNLAAITAGEQQKLAALSASFTKENELRTLYRDAGMLQEGAYQTNSLTAFHAYTAKRKDLLVSSEEEIAKEEARVKDANIAVREAKLALITDKQAADKREAVWKEYEEGVQSLGEKAKADRERLNKERLATEEEYTKRITALGLESVKAVYLAEEEFKKSKKTSAAEDDKSARVEALAAAYSHVTEGATAAALAQKAAAEAGLQATFAMEAALAVQDELVNKQQMGADAVFNNVLELMQAGKEVPAELLNTLDLVEKALERSKALRNNVAEEGAKNVVSATSKAFNKVLTDDMLKFQRGFADAIETALFEGGEAGKKKLRDLIVAELRKPITLFIQASVKALFDGTGVAGSMGSAGGSMGSAGGSPADYLKLVGGGDYAGAMSKFATSAFGEGLGLSSQVEMWPGSADFGVTTAEMTAMGKDLASFAQTAGTVISYASALNTAFSRNAQGGKDYGKAAGQAFGTYISGGNPIGGWIGGEIGSALGLVDYGGTSHSGGYGAYSKSGGVVAGASLRDTAGFGLSDDAITNAANVGSVAVAKTIVGLLEDTAATFGKDVGFYASTAFADDISPDGAWGSLMVKLGDKVLLDWADTQTSKWAPKEFSDGDAGIAEYASAVAISMRDLLIEQTPEWADQALQALGDAPTIDQLKDTATQINRVAGGMYAVGDGAEELAPWMKRIAGTGPATTEALKEIADFPELMLQKAGTSRDALIQTFTEGLMDGDPAAAGQAVANQLVASIEQTMMGTAAAQIFDIVNMGIVTPMIDAMLAGQSLSEAVSQASIDAVVEKAVASATAMAEVLNSPIFQEAMERVRTSVGGALGTSGAALSYTPQYQLPATTETKSTADELGDAVEELAKKFQSAKDSLLETGASLAVELLTAQGDTAGAAALQRSQYLAGFADLDAARLGELATIYDQNQAIRDQITAIEKANAVAEQRKDLERQILEATGDTATLRALELAALDESLRPLQERIYALADEAAATEKAKEASEKLASAWESLYSTADSTAAKFLTGDALKGFQLDRIAMQLNEALGTSLSSVQLDQATIANVQQAVLGVALDNAVPPEARAAVLRLGASLIDLKQSALDAATATAAAATATAAAAQAAEASRQAQQTSLQRQIADLSGDRATLLAFRELEISTLDGPLNQSLQRYIYLLQDQAAALDAARTNTDKAYSAIERAVSAQRTSIETQRNAAQSLVSEISSIFDTLKSNVTSLYDEVDSTRAAAAVTAQQTISQALATARATGALPEGDALNAAISAALSGINATQYSSQAEADFARLVLAGELKDLQDIGGTQLTTAEQQVKLAEDQLAALDGTLEAAKAQIDTLRGIDLSVVSVEQAIANLATALLAEKAAAAVMGGAGASADYVLGAGTSPDIGSYSKAAQPDIGSYSKAAQQSISVFMAEIAKSPGKVDQSFIDEQVRFFGSTLKDIPDWAVPSFDIGTNYVPNDMLAQVHRGEMIVPAAYNPATSGVGNAKLERLVEGLTAEVQRLQAIVNDGNQHQRRTADTLENVTEGGANMRTVTT